MDPRLLQQYNNELQHLREVGAEFATEFPKIADRLGLDGFDCADPYVERMLEGFAFLAARVHVRIDAEFPRFTQHLLEMVYPHYLQPIPSAVTVQVNPDPTEGSLRDGFTLPRDTPLRSMLAKGEQTPCEYRTVNDIKLWPLKATGASYFLRDLSPFDVGGFDNARAGLRLRLETTANFKFSDLAVDDLPVYVRGNDDIPMCILEQILGNTIAVIVRCPDDTRTQRQVLPGDSVQECGFADGESLFPSSHRAFSGYRLLSEYFAFHQRFMFFRVAGLQKALRQIESRTVELVFLFDRTNLRLQSAVHTEHFALNCVSGVNLFPKRTDRIHLSNKNSEYHIVPDRTRPRDFEVHSIGRMTGYGTSGAEQEFLPFYSSNDVTSHYEHSAYYTVARRPRVLSSNARMYGPRSSYIGSESFVSLVDSKEAPWHHDLRQLAVETLCTNRDLPLHMPVGRGSTDFTIDTAAPVISVRILDGPSKPRPSPALAGGEVAWRLISHLSLNYLTLCDSDERTGAAALRELLGLYGESSEPAIRKQIEGVRSVQTVPINRPLPVPGPIAFGRGVKIALTFEDSAFEGTGVFMLGLVLEHFFARYASINTFTETCLKTTERGDVIHWPARRGFRHTI